MQDEINSLYSVLEAAKEEPFPSAGLVNAIRYHCSNYPSMFIEQDGICRFPRCQCTTQKFQESEPDPTPAELRQAGVAFCPKCYTFGHDHSKSCIYYGKGTAFHKVRSIYEITGRTSK